MTEPTLPNGIPQILAYLATMARGYDNHLKWNEIAKLKSDLMLRRRRWIGVPTDAIANECRRLGMRDEDSDLICGLVAKVQSGRRLVPQRSYRDFHFPQPLDDERTASPPPTSGFGRMLHW